jgi:hypothetical protein
MFLKVVSKLLVFIILVGCSQASEPKSSMTPIPTLVPSTSSPLVQPSTNLPKFLRPDPDDKLILVSGEDPLMFRFLSDIELDIATLEKAIKEQMTSNHPERTELHYTINWKSDKEFIVSFSDLLPRETIHFSSFHAYNKDSGVLNEDTPHLFDIVSQHRDVKSPSNLVITDFNRFNHRYLPVTSSGSIKVVNKVGSEDAFSISYSNDNFQITDLNTNSVINVPIPIDKENNNFELLHGFQKFQFTDKYYSNYTYVVMSHSKVYRINTLTKNTELIYTSQLPILGITSSPNGNFIGLIVAQDRDLRSEVDLLVISDKGKETLHIQKAAYISHSDGYIGSYGLEWIVDNTIRTMTEFPNDPIAGQNEIDINTKSIKKIQNTNKDLEIIKKITAEEKEFTPFFSPDKSKILYVTRSNARFYEELWMTDITNNSTRFIGVGHFLGWISSNSIAWVEYGSDEAG